MKLTQLKAIACIVLIGCLFSDCTPSVPQQYRNKFAYRIDWNGEMIRGSGPASTQLYAWPEFDVYCRPGAQDCYDIVRENQGYGTVTVHMRGFYDGYYADTLSSYLKKHKTEFADALPDVVRELPGRIDSLADGYFTSCVSTKDSSILIIRDSATGPVLSNVVFVLKRTD